MLQYKIPQNVGIEDKIVGPLTLRQLIILAVGAGTSYVLFTLLNRFYELNILEYIVIAIPVLLAAASALLKINDVPFPKFVLLTLEYNIKPKKRVWDHRGIMAWIAPDIAEKKEAMKALASGDQKKKNVNLKNLSLVLDSNGFEHLKAEGPPDIDQAKDEELVTQAFFGQKKDDVSSMYWRSHKHDDQGKRLKLLAQLPHTQIPSKKEAVKAEAAPPFKAPQAVMATPPLASPLPTKSAVPEVRPLPSSATTPVLPKRPGQKPQKGPSSPPLSIPSREGVASGLPTARPDRSIGGQAGLPAGQAGKKRRRRRKKKNNLIARQETQINTLNKSKPVALMPFSKPTPPASIPPQKTMPPPKTVPAPSQDSLGRVGNQGKKESKPEKGRVRAGEFDLRELEKGEIEINLD